MFTIYIYSQIAQLNMSLSGCEELWNERKNLKTVLQVQPNFSILTINFKNFNMCHFICSRHNHLGVLRQNSTAIMFTKLWIFKNVSTREQQYTTVIFGQGYEPQQFKQFIHPFSVPLVN